MLSTIRLVTQSTAAQPAATRTSRLFCPANTLDQMSRSRLASWPATCQLSSPALAGSFVCSDTHCEASKPQPKFQISFDHSTEAVSPGFRWSRT